MYPDIIQKLIELFSEFPGVGPKTAARFVFYLTERNQQELDDLAKKITSLKTSLETCIFCFRLFDASVGSTQDHKRALCEICSDGSRNKNVLCVVEKHQDLSQIEQNKIYKGLYFILGGTVSNLKKESIEKLRIKELIERIKEPENFGISGASFQEIILALNSTVDGEATTLFLERKLKDLNKRITRLGRGLPVGGELEYADRETLRNAFERRN